MNPVQAIETPERELRIFEKLKITQMALKASERERGILISERDELLDKISGLNSRLMEANRAALKPAKIMFKNPSVLGTPAEKARFKRFRDHLVKILSSINPDSEKVQHALALNETYSSNNFQ